MPSAAAGVVIPFWLDRPPTEALEVAALAEELGYSELWVGEMLHFDAMALAGAIASLTRRITITVGPMALGYRKVLGDSGFNELIEASERGISSRHLAEQIGPAILGRIAAVGSLGEVRSSIGAYEQAGAEVMLAPITADDSGGRRTLNALAPNLG